jgi:hypothetical protein
MVSQAITPTAASGSAQSVTGAIRQAARVTGTNFQYLLAAAKVESNFDPSASARSSSAGGLFQFIDQTWLGTLKQSGASLGYGKYADAIQQTDTGKYVVSDANLRKEIMALRKDPTANAVMAGAFTKANAAYLTQKLGREPTDGELYMAHFMGARGAAKLINLAAATPNAIAADAFPRAAAANKSIFYADGGRPRSLADVTRSLSNRYDVARAATDPIAAPAAASDSARVAQAYAAAAPTAAAKSVMPSVTPAAAVAAVTAAAPATAAAPVTSSARTRVALADDVVFRNPYRAARSAPPSIQSPAMRAPASVAPDYVPPAQDTSAAASGDAWPARPKVKPGEPLNLFQDGKTDVRALFTGTTS